MSNSDILTFWCLRDVFTNMMDRQSLIAFQASCALSTISLECFLECLSHLARTLQYLHVTEYIAMLTNTRRHQRLWLYFISAHAITSRIFLIKPNYVISAPELYLAAVLTAKKKCSFVQFGHWVSPGGV